MPVAEREIAYMLNARIHSAAGAEIERFKAMLKGADRGLGGGANGAGPAGNGATTAVNQESQARRALDSQIQQNNKSRVDELSALEKAVAAEKKVAQEARDTSEEITRGLQSQQKARDEANAKVETANARVTAAQGQLREGFERTTEGVLKLGRGFAMLGLAGEEDTRKILEAMLKVQAVIDLTRGGIDLYRGLTSAARTYATAVEGIAAAEKAAAAARAVGAATGVAGAGAAAAGTAGAAAAGLSPLAAGFGKAATALTGMVGAVGLATVALGTLAVAARSKPGDVNPDTGEIEGGWMQRRAYELARFAGDSQTLGAILPGHRDPRGGQFQSVGDALGDARGSIETTQERTTARERAQFERDRQAQQRMAEFQQESQAREQTHALNIQQSRLGAMAGGAEGARVDLAGNETARGAAQFELDRAQFAQQDIRRRRAEAARTGNVAAAPTRQEEMAANDAAVAAQRELAKLTEERYEIERRIREETKAKQVEALRGEQELMRQKESAAREALDAASKELDIRRKFKEEAKAAVEAARGEFESDVAKFGKLNPFEQQSVLDARRRLDAGQNLRQDQVGLLEQFNEKDFREAAARQRQEAGLAAGAGAAFRGGQERLDAAERENLIQKEQFGRAQQDASQAKRELDVNVKASAEVASKIDLALKQEVKLDTAGLIRDLTPLIEAIRKGQEEGLKAMRDEVNEQFARLALGKGAA